MRGPGWLLLALAGACRQFPVGLWRTLPRCWCGPGVHPATDVGSSVTADRGPANSARPRGPLPRRAAPFPRRMPPLRGTSSSHAEGLAGSGLCISPECCRFQVERTGEQLIVVLDPAPGDSPGAHPPGLGEPWCDPHYYSKPSRLPFLPAASVLCLPRIALPDRLRLVR